MAIQKLFRCKFISTEIFVRTCRTMSNECNRNRTSTEVKYKSNETNTNANLNNQKIKYSAKDKDSQADDKISLFSWVHKFAPTFKLNGNKIEIIKGPKEFHQKLKELIVKSKKRILLGSLYLGISPLEQELVDSIDVALHKSDEIDDGNLKVMIILDYMRASRGSTNSRTMLLPLINHQLSSPSSLTSSLSAEKKSSLKLYLYHTPDLKGLLKKWLPERFNEIIGLFHIKAYVFDDTIIISGANLSETYFSDRQDRYVMIKDFKPLADFYHHLFNIISKYSFLVGSDDTLHYGDAPHPFINNEVTNSQFRDNMKGEVEQLISIFMKNKDGDDEEDGDDDNNNNDDDDDTDTVIYPLIQMGPMNVSQDERVTRELFTRLPDNSTVYLASGYFNITDEYMDIIIRSSSSSFHILTAAPQANSFYKSSGISGSIPPAYTYIASCFLQQVRTNKQMDRIKMYEYNRPGWTVHSKGVWLYPPRDHQSGPDLPYLTLVGSSNYGYRSVKRDLESQLLIVTNNEKLQLRLHDERCHLYKDSYELTSEVLNEEDRRVPYWVSFVAPRVKTFF